MADNFIAQSRGYASNIASVENITLNDLEHFKTDTLGSGLYKVILGDGTDLRLNLSGKENNKGGSSTDGTSKGSGKYYNGSGDIRWTFQIALNGELQITTQKTTKIFYKKFTPPSTWDANPELKKQLPMSFELYRDMLEWVKTNKKFFFDWLKFNNYVDDPIPEMIPVYMRIFIDAAYHPTIKNSLLATINTRLEISGRTMYNNADMVMNEEESQATFIHKFKLYCLSWIILRYINEPIYINSMHPDLGKGINDELTFSYHFDSSLNAYTDKHNSLFRTILSKYGDKLKDNKDYINDIWPKDANGNILIHHENKYNDEYKVCGRVGARARMDGDCYGFLCLWANNKDILWHSSRGGLYANCDVAKYEIDSAKWDETEEVYRIKYRTSGLSDSRTSGFVGGSIRSYGVRYGRSNEYGQYAILIDDLQQGYGRNYSSMINSAMSNSGISSGSGYSSSGSFIFNIFGLGSSSSSNSSNNSSPSNMWRYPMQWLPSFVSNVDNGGSGALQYRINGYAKPKIYEFHPVIGIGYASDWYQIHQTTSFRGTTWDSISGSRTVYFPGTDVFDWLNDIADHSYTLPTLSSVDKYLCVTPNHYMMSSSITYGDINSDYDFGNYARTSNLMRRGTSRSGDGIMAMGFVTSYLAYLPDLDDSVTKDIINILQYYSKFKSFGRLSPSAYKIYQEKYNKIKEANKYEKVVDTYKIVSTNTKTIYKYIFKGMDEINKVFPGLADYPHTIIKPKYDKSKAYIVFHIVTDQYNKPKDDASFFEKWFIDKFLPKIEPKHEQFIKDHPELMELDKKYTDSEVEYHSEDISMYETNTIFIHNLSENSNIIARVFHVKDTNRMNDKSVMLLQVNSSLLIMYNKDDDIIMNKVYTNQDLISKGNPTKQGLLNISLFGDLILEANNTNIREILDKYDIDVELKNTINKNDYNKKISSKTDPVFTSGTLYLETLHESTTDRGFSYVHGEDNIRPLVTNNTNSIVIGDGIAPIYIIGNNIIFKNSAINEARPYTVEEDKNWVSSDAGNPIVNHAGCETLSGIYFNEDLEQDVVPVPRYRDITGAHNEEERNRLKRQNEAMRARYNAQVSRVLKLIAGYTYIYNPACLDLARKIPIEGHNRNLLEHHMINYWDADNRAYTPREYPTPTMVRSYGHNLNNIIAFSSVFKLELYYTMIDPRGISTTKLLHTSYYSLDDIKDGKAFYFAIDNDLPIPWIAYGVEVYEKTIYDLKTQKEKTEHYLCFIKNANIKKIPTSYNYTHTYELRISIK